MKVLVIAALTSALLALPCQAIVGGQPTNGFQAVGVGVQVTPDWVLTARHVALPVGGSYSNGFGSRTVAARYDAGAGAFPANDLALLRLAPANGNVNVPSLAVAGDLFPNGSFVAPLPVTITSSKNSALARGYGFTTVSQFAAQMDPDGPSPLGPVTVNYLVSRDSSVYVQGGDSGGGLFLGHVTDSRTLLGLNSSLLSNGNGGFGSGFILLAAYRPWIDQTMKDDLFDTQKVAWVSAVPEPLPVGMWLLGGGMLAWRRARAGRSRPDSSVPGEG